MIAGWVGRSFAKPFPSTDRLILILFTDSMQAQRSLVSLAGSNSAKCGYCHSDSDSSVSTGVFAHMLEPGAYQRMIDHGWRRSGRYCYKPDMRQSCCSSYTIRLDAAEFQISKTQRRVLTTMAKYLMGGPKDNNLEAKSADTAMGSQLPEAQSFKPPKQTHKIAHSTIPDLVAKAENPSSPGKHELKVVLERSQYDDVTFALYCKYQVKIHGDKIQDLSKESFERFLVESPITFQACGFGVAPGYGSFHQKYYIDGKLIAVSVLDILPNCMSAVYFFYDPEYSFLSLGTYSALREISFTTQLNIKSHDLHYYYLGI